MMSRGLARELTKDEQMQQVVEEAIREGWEGELTPGGHIRFTHPWVDQPIFGPSSPSDHRSPKNTRSLLRTTLKQASEGFLQDRETARKADELLEEAGRKPLFDCPACQGRGRNKSFMSAEALVAHMEKDHPASPLEKRTIVLDSELESEPTPEEEVLKVSKNNRKPTLDEVETYAAELDGHPFTVDDIIADLSLTDTRDMRKTVNNRLLSLKKRKNAQLKAIERGTYIYGETPSTPTQEQKMPDPAPEPQEQKRPAGRLYEWVADTTDGRVIIKDDQGRAYFATFEEL